MSKNTRFVNKTTESTETILRRGVVEIIDQAHLEMQLKGNKKLRIKFGVDPTAPDIHLGHTIPLLKIRQFQDAGHIGVIIIGDYTVLIGDPSGRDKTRPPLSVAQVKKNSAQYKKQILKILDEDRTEFHFQSEWFKKFRLQDVLRLASHTSVSQLLAHETFKARLLASQPFMMHEMFYPLLQGYDSVAVRADVEVGGLDQKFNLLMGRTLQKHEGMPEQDIVMTQYLLGDGNQKMSKSLGNYIGINDAPDMMYGKVMAIPDNLVSSYFELLTSVPQEEISGYVKDMATRPVEIKKILAHEITAQYWGGKEAQEAAAKFQRTFQEHLFVLDIPEIKMTSRHISPLDLLVQVHLAESKSEAKRLIEQKGVFINDVCLEDWQSPLALQEGMQVRVGKRKAAKLRLI